MEFAAAALPDKWRGEKEQEDSEAIYAGNYANRRFVPPNDDAPRIGAACPEVQGTGHTPYFA